jgi:uncharacterized membrane protein (UPF0127 family)
MKKVIFVLIFLIFVLATAVIFKQQPDKNTKICFQDICYLAEIAGSSAKRERGLSGREKLPQDKGMLFIFEEEEIHPFWMKNMNFPLDIVWLDKDYKVVYLVENVKPCDAGACQIIYPDQNAQYVLEINAGEAGKIGLKEGNMMILKK